MSAQELQKILSDWKAVLASAVSIPLLVIASGVADQLGQSYDQEIKQREFELMQVYILGSNSGALDGSPLEIAMIHPNIDIAKLNLARYILYFKERADRYSRFNRSKYVFEGEPYLEEAMATEEISRIRAIAKELKETPNYAAFIGAQERIDKMSRLGEAKWKRDREQKYLKLMKYALWIITIILSGHVAWFELRSDKSARSKARKKQ